MKGLIIKDMFALRKQGKMMLMIAVFYIAFSIFTKNISMLGTMTALLCVMLPITTLSYDEYCKWDRYALAMPTSGRTIVLSKYILGGMLTLTGFLVVAAASIAIVAITGEMPVGEAIFICFVVSIISLAIQSIIFPIIFKFGVEKGRFIMLPVFVVPAGILYLLSKLGFTLPDARTLKFLAYLSPAAVLLIMSVSIVLSINIYRKKEF